MSGLPRAPSKRKYSWWWDSHISPKSSKWLQENLTDMDAKVKTMIKLIEEDADTFARRAEMYYEKRPELMNLVEEFYRAYRALAERYDNATGVIRQAQRTMPEAFLNQDQLGTSDDSPEVTTSDVKSFNFDGEVSESEVVSRFENEIQALKDALTQLEAEKEAGIIQYEESLDKINNLESEIYQGQEVCRELNDRANKAKGGVRVLRDSLTKLEDEKEASLLEYHKCLERIRNLENDVCQTKEEIGELHERASKAESEKDEAFARHKQSLELISDLENKLTLVEEDARQLKERADKAGKEVESLKQALAKLTEENESTGLRYHQCLEKISILEHELSLAEEEAKRLKGEVDYGIIKLKDAEEQCVALETSNQSLNTELGSLVLKMGSQSEQLTEKQKELAKLWTCLQEERFKFIEAETAFQTLHQLHSQTQEELRLLSMELENKGRILKDTETRNESLLNEIFSISDENKSLNECNISSSITIKEIQNDISDLLESKKKLAEEFEMQVDQRNALQEEIHCLKEDVNKINKKNQILLDQVEAVGLNPENLESSVKQLQTENLDLKEDSEKERAEKLLLVKKLAAMEQLLEKNVILKKSLSDLTAELEETRVKISALEQSFQALLEEKYVILAEKAAVMSQLHTMIENLENISEKNNCLEKSLSGACNELKILKVRLKTLEDSCESVEKEKYYLLNEKDTLILQGRTTHQSLDAIANRQRELEESYSSLEKEWQSTISKLEELRCYLDAEKNGHATFALRTETQWAGMEKQIGLLQDVVFSRRRELEEELDKITNYQLEIFILKRCIEDLKGNNSSLLAECQKLSEASKISETLISELKDDNHQKQVEVKSLSDKTNMFMMGIDEFSKVLGVDLGLRFEDKLAGDQKYLSHMISKLVYTNNSLRQVLDENQRLNIEISVIVTLLGQLSMEGKTVDRERETLDNKLKIKNEQLILSQCEANKLQELNEELNVKLSTLASSSTKADLDESLAVRNNQKNQIQKLSGDNAILFEENLCLQKTNLELGNKLKKLHQELGLTTQLLEGEGAKMFEELQHSTTFGVSLEVKFIELKDIVNSKETQLELLEKRVASLEGENEGLKVQLASYAPLVMSLKDSISSIENHTSNTKPQKSYHEGGKKIVPVSSKNRNADEKALNVYSELKDLEYKVKVIERAVVRKETLVAQENLCANTKLEAPKKSTDGLKLRECPNKKYSVLVYDNSEIEEEITMKDIMLDKNSESSSVELSRKLERKSQGKRVESWDSSDLDCTIDFIIGRDKRIKSPSRDVLMKRQKSKYQSYVKEGEKELGVDKLKISRTLSQRSQEANKTKILERLNSDAQKLTNLQITVQDMMKKLEISEKGHKDKTFYKGNTLRDQLEEAEEAIVVLSDYNGKLMRSVEKRSFSSNIRAGADSEESANARRRRISEQARKVSEKIGRLQLEMQKMQSVLLNIDDKSEKETKGKSRITEMRRRIILRDYLYGGMRTSSYELRKKRPISFCGFVQPPTRGD